jgi:alpha-methylacyl-CoA racemase
MNTMGPLSPLRVVELASSAPCAFAATLLADLGADVVRVERPAPAAAPAARAEAGAEAAPAADPLRRSRRSVAADLKSEAGRETVHRLLATADVLLEGFRPGVCERMGLDPAALADAYPQLVIGRLSGWGQEGAWAQRPAHDIAVLAAVGALADDVDDVDDTEDPASAAVQDERPLSAPSSYLSSFAGGGMFQVIGVLAALSERSASGRGQVVDASMADGAAWLDVMIRQWRRVPGNVTVTEAPFYTTYTCQDGRRVAVGAIEDRLYEELVQQLAADAEVEFRTLVKGLDRNDRMVWPVLHRAIAERFAAAPRAHWLRAFAEHEAGVVPVLTLPEAAQEPALRERGTFVEVAGSPQPAPAPRFSRSSSRPPTPAPRPGRDTAEVLRDWSTPHRR